MLAIADYALTLWLNRRKQYRWARHLLFWAATYHMTVATVLLPGYRVDSHNWFLIIAASTFLIPDAHEKMWRYAYAPLSLGLYFLLGFNVFEIEPIRQAPPAWVPIVKLAVQVSFVSVSAYLVSMFLLIYQQPRRY